MGLGVGAAPTRLIFAWKSRGWTIDIFPAGSLGARVGPFCESALGPWESALGPWKSALGPLEVPE